MPVSGRQPPPGGMSQTQSQSQPRFDLPQKTNKSKKSSAAAPAATEAKIKPEIKEKPLFSTFKQKEQNDSFRLVMILVLFH